MENANEIIDSTTDTDAEQQIDHSLDTDAKVQALEEQNKKLFARAKRAEGFILNQDGRWVKKRPSEDKEIINRVESSKSYNILEDDVADLILQGYSKDETKFILANGGRKSLEDKNSFVAVAINTKREQRQAEDASNQTGRTSGHFVDAEQKVTLDQLKNMSVEEMKKILPKAGER